MIKKSSFAFLMTMGLLLFSSQIGVTQTQSDLEAIKKDLEAIKNNQKILRQEVETLKRAISSRGRSAGEFEPKIVDVANDPYKGDLNARLTLVDFSDYQ